MKLTRLSLTRLSLTRLSLTRLSLWLLKLFVFGLFLGNGLTLPASAQSPMTSYHDNYDTDTVGATPSGVSDTSGTAEVVTAGSPLSSPNWLSNGTANFGIEPHAATFGARPYSAGDVQFSYVLHVTGGNGYQAMKAEFNFATGLYEPLLTGSGTVEWYNTKSGAVVGSAVAVPAFYIDSAKVTQKQEYDPTTTGGPTLRLKLWQYGTAEPGSWTLVSQDTSGNALTGGFSPDLNVRNTGTSTAVMGLDDYFEGPVGSTFVTLPSTQNIAPNAAGIIYDKGVWALSGTNATCVDAGAKITIPFKGSQLLLTTNEGDGNQCIRYHIVTPGATASQGSVPPWVTVNLNAGSSTIYLDSGDPDTSIQHTCYISFYRHGYTDLWGNSGQAIPTNALNITGYAIDATATLGTALAGTIFTNDMVVVGDSIVEGYSADPVTGLPDATFNWVEGVGRALLCNVVRFAHGGQGYTQVGSGNVPAFNTAYSNLFYGVSRLTGGVLGFTPKYWIDEQGTNGPWTASDVVTAITNARAVCGPATKIIEMVPLNGGGLAAKTAAVATYKAAHPTDTNVYLLDLSGWDLARALGGSTGVPGYRGKDTLHPDNYQSGEIAAAVAAGILQVTTATGTKRRTQ